MLDQSVEKKLGISCLMKVRMALWAEGTVRVNKSQAVSWYSQRNQSNLQFVMFLRCRTDGKLGKNKEI